MAEGKKLTSSYFKQRPDEYTGIENELDRQLDPVNVQGNKQPDIRNYSYPDGIAIDDDKQHYIQFFIRMRGKSKFLTERGQSRSERVKFGTTSDYNFLDPEKPAVLGLAREESVVFKENETEDLDIGNRLSPDKIGAKEIGTLTGLQIAGVGTVLSDFFGGRAGVGTLAKGVLFGGIGAGVGSKLGEFLDDKGILQPDKTLALKDSIALHISNPPTYGYSMQYQEDKIGAIGGALLGGANFAEFKGGEGVDIAGIEGIPKEIADLALRAGVGGVAAAIGGPAGRAIQLGTKTIVNAFREQFFEQVDYRTFNFRYTFMPSSPLEGRNVKNIINLFKFHMHPELTLGNLFYLYPSEFSMVYYYGKRKQDGSGNTNDYFERISTCYLEDMQVEYGGDIFASFDNGEPVEVNMTLRFREIELLTKARIKEDF